jgi:GH15 family glucan-1,4-alpha-glucosidase
MGNLIDVSVHVLKDLQVKSGGFLATKASDAYPYVYIRDAIYMAKALDLLGHCKETKKFYDFLFKIQEGGNWHQRYYTNGKPHVSRPKETDAVGLALHGVYVHYRVNQNKELLKKYWPNIKEAIAYLKKCYYNGLLVSQHSVHEYRHLEAGFEIWCNCACTRGIADMAVIANELGKTKEGKEWEHWAKKLRTKILKRFWLPSLGVYAKCIKESGVKITSPDITMISPLYFDLAGENGRDLKMLQKLENLLWDKKLGGFLRFRKFEGCTDWHWYTGGQGPWVVFTLQAARVHYRYGSKKKAKDHLNWVEKIKTKDNLLPEHIALKKEYNEWKMNETEFSARVRKGMKKVQSVSKKDIMYWATPLGWSHAEYLLTLMEFKRLKTVVPYNFGGFLE